jgi:nucleoside-diphosphate-sugar epimerase
LFSCLYKVTPLKQIALLLHSLYTSQFKNNCKAKTLLGWEPKLTLEEGLRQAIAFSQAHPSHQGTAGLMYYFEELS